MPRDDKRQIDEMNVQDKKAKRGGKTKTVAAASKRKPAKARVVRGRPKPASKAASTRGKAKAMGAKAGSARSKAKTTRAKSARSLAKTAMGTAKTAVKRVKRSAARGAKTAMAVEKSIVKTTKNIVKAATPKRRRKKTVASIVAKARRQNAKTDYNPLHMLAKLSPF